MGLACDDAGSLVRAAGPGGRGAASRRDGRPRAGSGRGPGPPDLLGCQPGRREEARRLGRIRDAVSARDPAQRRCRRHRRRRRSRRRMPGSASASGCMGRSPTARSARLRSARWCPPIRPWRCRMRCPTRSVRASASRASQATARCSATDLSPARRCSFTGCSVAWLDRRTARGVERRDRDRDGAAQQRARRGRRRGRPPRGARRSRPGRRRSAASLPTASIASSRSSLSDNADLDAAVAAPGAVIAAYATRDGRTGFPFWPMLFNNLTIRLLGSDDFPAEAKHQAARTSPRPRRRRPADPVDDRCRSTASPKRTIASTPARASGSCCRFRSDPRGRPSQRRRRAGWRTASP